MNNVMIITGAPAEYIEPILDAIVTAGGAVAGEYTHCSFRIAGTGSFKPSAGADPFSGEKGVINRVEEIRLETFCPRENARAVVNAIRAAHPYQEPVIYIVPLLSEDEL